MNKRNISIATKNIKKNFWLLFSTSASIILFTAKSPLSSAIIITLFVVGLFSAIYDVPHKKKLLINQNLVRIVLMLLIIYIGYKNFRITWASSSKIAYMTSIIGVSISTFLRIFGLILSIVSSYAIYTFLYSLVSCMSSVLNKEITILDTSILKINASKYWYFPISAIAFFCLNATLNIGYLIGLLFAFIITSLITPHISTLAANFKYNSKILKFISLFSSVGICLANQEVFYEYWSILPEIQKLNNILNPSFNIINILGFLGALLAIPFIYICLLVFWNNMIRLIKSIKLLDTITNIEKIIYSILIVVTISLVVYIFLRTQAFYGTKYWYDIIYTSDSPVLVKGNVYMILTHQENDLRQPLFAIFTAPFVSIPYLLGKIAGGSLLTQAIMLNIAQIMMLFTANFMLTRIMKLNSKKRICFMILASCTYTQLLFCLMMEQYISAYFWVVFTMLLISERKSSERIGLWGASGTLLTSIILLPFMSKKNPFKEFKSWIVDLIKYGLEFIAVIIAFCRFDVFYNLIPKITQLSNYTGQNISFVNKVYQYTEFVSSCFLAPNALVDTSYFGHASWRLDIPAGINLVGIIIMILVFVSAIYNRHKSSSLLSIGWVGFSVIMLLGLGWGTVENGLILYALYFSWAFLILLFQLIEKIEDTLNFHFLVPLLTCITVVSLLYINIQSIIKMVNFAITYFPV